MPSAFDFDSLVNNFDQVQPLMAGATTGILEHVPPLGHGTTVLDIACGTGEPGLTLAEHRPGTHLIGVDSAEPMVGAARRKAEAKGLADTRFAVMDSRHLDLADASVDCVVSRFGVLSFADPMAEAREMSRVLRPDGGFAVATWDAASKNVLTYAIASAVDEWLPPQATAAMRRMEQFAMPGRRESWLRQAGFSKVDSSLWTWPVEFADEEAMWALAGGPAMLQAVVTGLDDDHTHQARDRVRDLTSEYRRSDGTYVLPYACRLLWGTR
ncbi:class I SAM-dependent methyltransferase [Actinoallomurus bryophytorum]|uniref:Ubiquinone/menaquinone biosynthesis C-methylase UbiE n=1 Tax=Actinoallomurus bryophytorum TaxID=1490222 RepID=A0A543CT36_9ACTN|nr:class I SAM-dependent methyltransferase [Actinoallomurus bryophytorum]TQM00078.1 ubiquinone/menaquinone biosynthesis C-methylase UbiE [Actinoallomurus bryophytorum]